jgi:hypothetical protein
MAEASAEAVQAAAAAEERAVEALFKRYMAAEGSTKKTADLRQRCFDRDIAPSMGRCQS